MSKRSAFGSSHFGRSGLTNSGLVVQSGACFVSTTEVLADRRVARAVRRVARHAHRNDRLLAGREAEAGVRQPVQRGDVGHRLQDHLHPGRAGVRPRHAGDLADERLHDGALRQRQDQRVEIVAGGDGSRALRQVAGLGDHLAGPGRAGPRRARPGGTGPRRARPGGTGPRRTRPGRTRPRGAGPRRDSSTWDWSTSGWSTSGSAGCC